MNVCLFGGTFDPVHLGHEYIISKLLSKFDKIIIIPSKKSPAKKQNPIANSSSRLEMLSLCEFANNEKCIISNFELESDTLTNYTIDTIKWLESQFPKSKIYLAPVSFAI